MKAPYTVGYGKPPKNSQFKKGKSGNPLGRSIKRMLKGGAKAPLSFQNALITELKSPITITEAGGQKKKVTRLEAIAKIVVTQALKGDEAALRRVLAELPKLPHDAFFKDGDGKYTYRYTEAQRQALESFVKECENYEIPEEDQDGSPSSS
jgi:hypothetical protein